MWKEALVLWADSRGLLFAGVNYLLLRLKKFCASNSLLCFLCLFVAIVLIPRQVY